MLLGSFRAAATPGVQRGAVVLLLSVWIVLPILFGYTGRTEQDETVYFEPVVEWFESGAPGNAYVAGLQEGVARISFLQPPGWLYFLAPFYALFGFSYLTVRIAFAVETIALGFLLATWSSRSTVNLGVATAVFALAMTTSTLETGRMDLLAGMLLASVFWMLRRGDQGWARGVAIGVLLGLAGLVHAIPGVTGVVGVTVALGLGKAGRRRLPSVFAAAAATVALLWLPLLWGHWDMFGDQFVAHGQRHLALFGGVGKIPILARSAPIVLLPLLLATAGVAMSRDRVGLLASREYRFVAVPLAVMVGVVLCFTVTWYYYLNYFIPLGAWLLILQVAAATRWLDARAAGRSRSVGSRAVAVAMVLAVLVVGRGRLLYDQLLIALNGLSSPEAMYAEVVRSSVAPGSFVVADPVAYYAVRPLARTILELETFGLVEGPSGYESVDYLVLLERRGDLFYRIRNAAAREYLQRQFVPVADRLVSVRSLSPGAALRGRVTVRSPVGRLVVLRNRDAPARTGGT